MKMISGLRASLLALAAAATVAGCAPQTNSAVYSNSAVMQTSVVRYGTIVDARMVETRNVAQGDRAAGVILGGIAGAAAGNQFGGGNGKVLMTGAGAIAGAALGDNLAQRANRHATQQWFVRLDNGQTIAVLQNDPTLAIGAHVKVIQDGNSMRIVR